VPLSSSDAFKHPYYIVAPRYVRTSGGVRVLFRLADLINKAGGSAFVFLWPYFNHELASSPMDIAPFLNRRIVDYHFQSGLTPIVVYPETVHASKFSPPVRVRYLLNYNELLFRNEPLEADDYILAFSQAIDDQIRVEKPRRTIFLPVSDPLFFCPPTEPLQRSGGAFYAGKFKYHFGGKTLPITEGMPEITRDQPDSQTPEQIRSLFQRSEVFYCYEDSALALEAILCGCPVVFLPNEHFQKPLGGQELKGFGYAWGASPEQIRHAHDTVAAAREEHLRRLSEIQGQIRAFIVDTQEIAAHRPYKVPFAYSALKPPGLLRRLIDISHFFSDVINDRGLTGTLKIVVKRILSRRFSI
jgi:hypothetical protein